MVSVSMTFTILFHANSKTVQESYTYNGCPTESRVSYIEQKVIGLMQGNTRPNIVLEAWCRQTVWVE